MEHDPDAEIGEVVSLYRSGSGDCWAVATSEADRLAEYPAPLYLSAQFRPRFDESNLVLEAMALTTESATLSKRPVEMFSGQLDSRYDRSRWNVSGLHKRLVEHAASGLRERSKRSCVLVYDELQATEVVRTRGGYFVGGEFVAVDLRPHPRA